MGTKTVIVGKNKVNMFMRSDKKLSTSRNSEMKVWKRRGTLQKTEEFSECDDKRKDAPSILGKEQWTKEAV